METLRLPQGPDQDRTKAMVTAVRTARIRLRAVGAAHQFVDSCFTIDMLVEKLDGRAQTRWLYYQAEHPNQKKCKAVDSWLELEGRVAVKHRQHMLAAKFLTVPESRTMHDTAQSEIERPEFSSNARTSEVKDREGILQTDSYGIGASVDELRCPACNNQHAKKM